MPDRPKRETVDLTNYPDLAVIYLGMRVNTLAGIRTVLGFGNSVAKAIEPAPDGLLRHENVMYSLRHVGFRQYWRDFDALEAWARSEPHRVWWQRFLRDRKGTGFWHETYFRKGGMEAVYIDMPQAPGFGRFAPLLPAQGGMFSARKRAGVGGEARVPAPVGEEEIYTRG